VFLVDFAFVDIRIDKSMKQTLHPVTALIKTIYKLLYSSCALALQ